MRLTRALRVALGAALSSCASGTPPPAHPELLGMACEPPPSKPDGTLELRGNRCGPYLCADGTCRSCVSDRECQEQLGAPRCLEVPGKPGKRCGREAPAELAPAAAPSDHARPPASP